MPSGASCLRRPISLEEERRVTREPRQKGTSVLPVIAQLKNHPDREKLVPQPLWKYFDDHLLVSAWYPEEDYFTMLQALVKTIDPKTVGGDVWRYFARYSVQRDIAGGDSGSDSKISTDAKSSTPGKSSTEIKAVYRNFASDMSGDPSQLFRRATRLWSQYHDSGSMQVSSGRARTNSVFVRLIDFHIPIEGFVRLQGYYLEEFGHLVGVELKSKVTRSTARGQEYCEWEYTLARTPVSEAFVASLPPVP
jgi:hypothetical protein